LHQDEDVLDTWFSSWLWPFSTLGWPNQTRDLEFFFPTDSLVTGPDIIFFWVARMIMASLKFMDDIPFRDVYFNGMIRDLKGRKMSKSLGNSPDPLWLINGADPGSIVDFARENPTYREGVPAYGADAVRLTMVYTTPLGGDIRFDHTLVELGQKFCNKLWNAARFILMNTAEDERLPFEQIEAEELTQPDRWILSRLHKAVDVVNRALKAFKLNDATHAAYSFVWSEFCDWYLEIAKLRLYDDSRPRERAVAGSIAAHVLERIVRLLHPFMPFITEEIGSILSDSEFILQQPYPVSERRWLDKKSERNMVLLQKVISAIRNIRGEMNVPPAKAADVVVRTQDDEMKQLLLDHADVVAKLAHVSGMTFGEGKPDLAASAVVSGTELFVPLAELIDVDVERQRLSREIVRLEKLLRGLNVKLTNQSFLSRAPESVIKNERDKKENFEQRLNALQDHLHSLGGA